MGIDIAGWIEVCRLEGAHCADEHAWSGVVRLGPLIDVADEVSEYLFGFSKSAISGEATVSVAANRGLPPHPSQEVLQDIEQIRGLQAQYGSGECGGYTYATWREIQDVRIRSEQLAESDWRIAFELASSLGRSRNIPDHQIRFVLWYVW